MKPRRPKNSLNTSDFARRNFSGSFAPVRVMACSEQHQELEINYLVGGGMTYLLHGEIFKVLPGQFYLFWAAAPHQVIHRDKQARIFWFTLPLAWILQSKLPAFFIERLIAGKFIMDLHPSPRDEPSCLQWIDDLKSASTVAREIAFEEIVSRLRRIASCTQTASPNQKIPRSVLRAQPVAQYVEQIARVVAQRYQEPLTISDIATAVKLHPNYAMTVFRKACGISIQNYLIQHRLFHAQRLLSTTNEKVINIALASGFNSQSRFYDAFRKKFGISPIRYQRSLNS